MRAPLLNSRHQQTMHQSVVFCDTAHLLPSHLLSSFIPLLRYLTEYRTRSQQARYAVLRERAPGPATLMKRHNTTHTVAVHRLRLVARPRRGVRVAMPRASAPNGAGSTSDEESLVSLPLFVLPTCLHPGQVRSVARRSTRVPAPAAAVHGHVPIVPALKDRARRMSLLSNVHGALPLRDPISRGSFAAAPLGCCT